MLCGSTQQGPPCACNRPSHAVWQHATGPSMCIQQAFLCCVAACNRALHVLTTGLSMLCGTCVHVCACVCVCGMCVHATRPSERAYPNRPPSDVATCFHGQHATYGPSTAHGTGTSDRDLARTSERDLAGASDRDLARTRPMDSRVPSSPSQPPFAVGRNLTDVSFVRPAPEVGNPKGSEERSGRPRPRRGGLRRPGGRYGRAGEGWWWMLSHRTGPASQTRPLPPPHEEATSPPRRPRSVGPVTTPQRSHSDAGNPERVPYRDQSIIRQEGGLLRRLTELAGGPTGCVRVRVRFLGWSDSLARAVCQLGERIVRLAGIRCA
eukprot:355927-Chlamydomonas_euryale.AAC.5